jgi:hypothetical protein
MRTNITPTIIDQIIISLTHRQAYAETMIRATVGKDNSEWRRWIQIRDDLREPIIWAGTLQDRAAKKPIRNAA